MTPLRLLRSALGLVLVAGLLGSLALTGHAGEAEEAELERPDPPGELIITDPRSVLGDFPDFQVPARKPILEEESDYYPCTDCHDGEEDPPADPRSRVLEDDHDEMYFEHGRGRFWCLTCHDFDDRDSLRSVEGQLIDFDDSFLLCGQCHFQRQKDFFFGAHGKRVGNWRGERVLTSCVSCHDPHSPSIKPRKPKPPPQVRRGLERVPPEHDSSRRPWERTHHATEHAPQSPEEVTDP